MASGGRARSWRRPSRHGTGAALVRPDEVWAQERGYRELAADALLDAIDSQRAHESRDFIDVEREVRNRKDCDVMRGRAWRHIGGPRHVREAGLGVAAVCSRD
jgi:hypothetical protein